MPVDSLMLTLNDIEEKYRARSSSPAFSRLYQEAGRWGQMFSVLHEELNGYFEEINGRAETTRHYWADNSRGFIQLIKDLTEDLRSLKQAGVDVKLEESYQQAIEQCKTWLSSSGGSAVPKEFRKVELITHKEVFSETSSQVRLFLRRHTRWLINTYAVILLVVTSVQAVCLLLILRKSQDWAQHWASFGRDFATSPAAAGLCAVIAASLGAAQLSRQLTHSKKKASEEAWWQQFEWVTDRVVSTKPTGEIDHARLPSSLAFDLMIALSRSATEPFQVAAVTGILNHYLKDFRKQQAANPNQDEVPNLNDPSTKAADTPILDQDAAESLRILMGRLPSSSRTRASAVLRAYEQGYEEEVMKALRHQFGDDFQAEGDLFGAEAVIQVGAQRMAVQVKDVRDRETLEQTARGLEDVMGMEAANHGLIITPPTSLNMGRPLSRKGVHLIEWNPNRSSSGALKNSILSVLLHDRS